MVMKKSTGEFGKLVKSYVAVRPGYPKSIIRGIIKEIGQVHPVILDLGCGTGIATRQLGDAGAMVVGCDIDMDMLNAAARCSGTNVSYALASAEKIPFGRASFDAVTIFTAFHWFATKKALSEMRRVLKPGGRVFVVHPRHTAPFTFDLRNILERHLRRNLPPKYDNKIDFVESLHVNKFIDVGKNIVKATDVYTLDQYVSLLQSYSIWNYVPKSQQEAVVKVLKRHFKTKLVRGFIHDTVDIEVISARVV